MLARRLALLTLLPSLACVGQPEPMDVAAGSSGGDLPPGSKADTATSEGGSSGLPEEGSTGSAGGSSEGESSSSTGGCDDGDLECEGLWGPGCELDGCVRALEFVTDVDASLLSELLGPQITIDNGYAVYRMRYVTAGRENLAVITVPDTEAEPFHVVVNNHGTTGLDDACALAPTDVGIGLAGTFGARGMIGVAPDYPGLGTDGLLPYLVSDVEGASALDAARATLHVAAYEGIGVSGRAAVVGLSEGGHATLAAAAMHESYAPELDVRAFGAAGPASVWQEHWRDAVGFIGPHQAFQAMVMYAWADHYGFDDGPIFAPTAGDLDALMSSHCYAHPTAPLLEDVLSPDPQVLFEAAFLGAYQGGTLGDGFPGVEQAFALNRIVPFSTPAAVRIWQGTADDIVLEVETSQMVADLQAGGTPIDYTLVDGGGHTDVAFSYLAQPQLRTEESLAWLHANLDD